MAAPQEHQQVIQQTRRRIGVALGLRTGVAVLSGWLLAWGILVVILRASLSTSRGPLLWGLTGIVVAVACGVISGIRRRPSLETVRALLDHYWHSGGLLMASAESNPAGWAIRIPDAAVPRVRWVGRRHWWILLGCGLFAMTSFLVPARVVNQFRPNRLQVGTEVEKLAEKIEVLKEEKILPPERAKSLEEALRRLQQEAAGNDPGKTWEAMDHLEQAIAKASAEAAADALRNAQKSAQSEELAAALDKAREQMNPSDLTTAMNQLSKDVLKAAKLDELLAGEIPDELKEQLEKGELTAQQLAELSQKLGECKECNLAKARKLAAARMIDPALLDKLDGQFQIDPDALAELLAACEGEQGIQMLLAEGNKPGRGGVNRGRGDAAMTWTGGSDRNGMEFKEKTLPPGAVAALKDAQLQGVSIAAPTPNSSEPSKAGGALDPTQAGRGSARTQVVLPEHRKVVQRYFERESSSGTP